MRMTVTFLVFLEGKMTHPKNSGENANLQTSNF